MTTIAIAGLSIGIAIALIASSYLYSKTRTEPFMFGAGTIILLLTGLVLLISPLSYVSGETIITPENSTTTTVTNTYTTGSTILNTGIALTLILIGLFGTSSAITRFKLSKSKDEKEDWLEFDD